MRNAWPCPVCGGPQIEEDGKLVESRHDQRFHALLERIEKLERAADDKGAANDD